MGKPHNVLWTTVLAVILLAILLNFYAQQGINQIGRTDVDFPAYYFASILVFQEHLSPYQPVHWHKAEDLVGQELWPYVYPPPSLFFFAPLNWLSYELAQIIFLGVNHLLTLFIAYLLFKKLLKIGNILYWLIALSYLYLFYPLAVTISYGQINLIVLSLILLFWIFLKQGRRPELVALPLTVAIVLKVYPLIFLPYLLLKRRFSHLLWVFIFLGLAVAASVFALPTTLWEDWQKLIFSGGYGESFLKVLLPGSMANQSINGFTSRLFIGRNLRIDTLLPIPWAAKLVPYLLSGAVLLITYALLLGLQLYLSKDKRIDKHQITTLDWEISILLIAMYLVAPFSWDHHLVFLLPAIYVATLSVLGTKHQVAWLIPLSIVALVLASDYPFNHPLFHSGTFTLLISLKFYAVTLLWAIYCLYLGIRLKDAIASQKSFTLAN